jgi:hypothetical protein
MESFHYERLIQAGILVQLKGWDNGVTADLFQTMDDRCPPGLLRHPYRGL